MHLPQLVSLSIFPFQNVPLLTRDLLVIELELSVAQGEFPVTVFNSVLFVSSILVSLVKLL